MNYQQTLDYIFSKLPMFSRVGASAIKNGFANILALCNEMGQPQADKKFIHVAGTNGKGSVSHMLAAILQTAGYKTGLYTSPHLKDVRERVKINGQQITEEELISFIQQMQAPIETIKPSFFEITAAMAFHFFNKNDVDVAVVETGLGGRLDSTNIITPIVSIITNIGYDHVQILGNTLPEIATEKAGIIKQNIPVIIGEWHKETAPIFEKIAAEKNAPLYFADKELQLNSWNYINDELIVEVAKPHKTDHYKYHLDMPGLYQAKNLLTVLQSCKVLQDSGFAIAEEHIARGIQHTKKITGLHGRWEVIHKEPKIIVDVAHNESGMQQLVNQLEITSYHNLHIVLGMVKDKDVEKVLSLLPQNATYYFTQANVPRAMMATELQTKACAYNLYGKIYTHVNEAIQNAKAHAHKDDLILVCGSVFLVGEVNNI